MRCTCLLLVLLSVQCIAGVGKTLNRDLSRFISGTKVELAQSFLEARVVKKDVAKVNISEERNGEINFAATGRLAALFRRSNENFIINGSQIFQLRKKLVGHDSSQTYFLDAVQQFSSEEGAILFKQTEWKNILFLAVCYRQNYCRALMSHPTRSITFQQRLSLQSTPTDLEFFLDDRALFIIVTGDPSKIYRWTGTYFDEHEELDTSGARAVATFCDKDATVIVVAQNLELKQVYSKVFVRRNRKTELIQMLQTKEATDVVSYSLDSGNETLNFVFVLSKSEESTIFWWNGREFSLWKRVQDVVGPGRIYLHKILSHLFFFFSQRNKLSVYHLTEMTFDLIHVISLDRNILDVDVREEVDRSPMLLLLKASDSESLLTLALFSLDVNYVPLADNKIAVDPVLQCLLQLENLLEKRDVKLNESMLLSNEMGKNSKIMELKKLTIPKVELESFKINELKVNPLGEKLEATPTEMREKLKRVREESEALLAKLESTLEQVRYRFHGDIIVGRMKASNIHVKKFNDRAFDLNNIISITKNQTLSGTIHLKTLSANALTLPSISGVYVKDVLLRKKPLQAITGEHTVRSMRARNFVIGRLGKLNGTHFSSIKGFPDTPHKTVSDKKTFPRMGVTQLEVDYINNEPAEQWLAKILPTTQDFGPQEEALNFTRLQVTDLIVSNINGNTWQQYLMTSKRSGWKENPSTMENIRTGYLRAKRINGIEAASFLTRDTPQQIDSNIKISSVSSERVAVADLLIGSRQPSSVAATPNEDAETIEPSISVSEIIFRKPPDISGRILRFDELNKTYWMKSWPQELEASVTFTNQVTAKDMKAIRINRKELREFVAAEETKIEGRIIFHDVMVDGNVVVSLAAHRNVDLNHVYRSAVKTSGENRLRGKKIFLGNLSGERLSLGSLNTLPFGYNLPTTSGILRLQQAEIVGNVSAKEGVRLHYLNDHNFNDTIVKHVRLDERDVLQKGNYSSLSVKEMQVENINGIPYGNPVRNGNKWDTLKIVINGDLHVAQLQVITLNNITLNGYLNKVILRSGAPSTIKGRKLFQKVVSLRGNLDGALNGYNLTELERNALSKSKPQDITGNFVIDILNVNNADCQAMDGVSSENLVFEDGPAPQTIRSGLLFHDFAIAGNIRSKMFMDSCDLSKITRLKVSEIRKLGKLDVMGNLTWNRDRGEHKAISYLYRNAVTKHEEEIIGGSLSFRGNAAFDKITTKNNINDVDLEFIVKDAIYSSVPLQEIFQDITFRGKMTANNILIENNIIVDSINGIDILDLGQRLVRNNADIEVRGQKKWLSGFTTHRLTSEALNGAATEPIIFCDGGEANGSIPFTATTFHSVKTLKDLNVLQLNNVNLSKLLDERLSKEMKATASGNIRVKGPVSIRGDGGIDRINDLNIRDAIAISGLVDPRWINGRLEFNNTFSAVEKLKIGRLNHGNVTDAKERMLLNMTESVIKGNIIFKDDVEFVGNVDAVSGVNGCQFKKMTSMQLPLNIGYTETSYNAKIHLEIDKIANSSISLVKPIIFVDLEAISTVNLNILKVEKIKEEKYDGDNVEFNIYGLQKGEHCQTRSDCYCPTQKNFVISSPIPPHVLTPENVFPTKYKYFEEYLHLEITVTTSSSSYDSNRCDNAIDTNTEYATLRWRRKNGEREYEGKGNSTNFAGRLRDVKFFRMANSLFVIMAFYVGSLENKMSGLNVIVQEFDGRSEIMKRVQEMGMTGVEALELFWTPKGVVLVAGNGYDSDTSADSVDSAIYRFSDSDNQFRLLRSIKTHGILDIASIRHNKESFIFLVQKQSWPLLILKYNHEYDNYYFSQKLDADHSKVKSNFLSAAAFTTTRSGYEGDIFVGIVHSDDGFRLFKYKHIEGFVEEVRQEQRNVQMLKPFRTDSRQYLLAASSGHHSLIYEVTQQGYLQSNSSRPIHHFHF